MKLSTAQNFKKVAQRGFTLIELLVVIGILGILAAALIATIDPFEQLNKGADARTENTVVETQNALLRYYTIRGVMPWSTTAQGDDCMNNNTPSGTILNDMMDCVQALIDQGELRQAFTNSVDVNNIYISQGAGNEIILCYEPVSKAKQRDPNTIYDEVGDASGAANCLANDPDGDECYWCSR